MLFGRSFCRYIKPVFVTVIIFCAGLCSGTYAKAANIGGLSAKQIEDFESCLEKKGLTFNEINNWNNQYYEPPVPRQGFALYHNFIIRLEKPAHTFYKNFDRSIITSGLFYAKDQHSFKNSILANVTFVGDFSELDFSGACLVNVRFHKASLIQTLRIKRNSEFYKNISIN